MRASFAAPVLAIAVLLISPATLLGQEACSSATITAYSVEQYPGLTADGTPTRGSVGAIVAASTNYALGSYLTVDGLGTYRVADRGHLGPNHVDVLMQTTAEARQFGRQSRQVCR